MLLEEMAKELVTYTSDLVGGRTINIMNTEGIIIASTEEHRIGSFHQGALDAVRTGKPVAIEPEEVSRYPGAKQGYNMPIRIDGDIIGVIGIFGTPSEIRPLAQLLEVFAVKYYQLEAMTVPRLAEMELRSRLLRNLLFPTSAAAGNTRMLMQELHFQLHFPATLAVVADSRGSEDPSWAANLTRIFREKKLISPEKDLWSAENNTMVILAAGDGFAAAARRSGLLAPEGRYTVCIGDLCEDVKDVPRSFEQAVTLNAINTQGFMDISDPGNRMRYLIRHTAEQEAAYFERYLGRLEKECPEEELRILLGIAAVYYDESHSVSKAASRLFIHKNTLQYRMKKLESVLGIADWPEFRKEYLVRLLIECYERKQGLRTLLK